MPQRPVQAKKTMQVLQLALEEIAAQPSDDKQAKSARSLLLAISQAGQDIVDAAATALQAAESGGTAQNAK